MYLIDTYISPPASNLKGGAEKQLYLLASSLDSELFKPIVMQLSPEDSLPIKHGQIGAGEVCHLPTPRFYNLHGFRQLGRLCSVARENKVDIIHTFFEKSEVMGWFTCRRAGVSTWVTSRRDLGFNRKAIYDKVFRMSSKNCKKCVANCLAVKEEVLRREMVKEDKVDVIYNGLDLSPYQLPADDGILRNELGIKQDSSLVGMVANFNFEIKGHQYFLEAAKNISGRFPQVVFLLVGDGPLRHKYQILANKLGLREKVYFLGKRDDVATIVRSLDVSVLSSTSEGLSNVILESMAAGKPVVATSVGGSPEVVTDGTTGYLVPPADPMAMAKAVVNLLEDPGKAMAMGLAGRKIVEEKFTVEAMVRSYERLYFSLLEDRG